MLYLPLIILFFLYQKKNQFGNTEEIIITLKVIFMQWIGSFGL